MDANLIDGEIKKLQNLINYKEYTQEALEKIAKVNIRVREFKSQPLFTNPEEQQLAEERFKSYLENHELESMSELDTLRSLVYNEIFETRIQKELNRIDEKKEYPPEKLTKQLTDIQNQKMELKVKLGIDNEEKVHDDLTGYQMLMKRGDKYIQAHRNEFTLWISYTCKKCGHKDCESYLIAKKVKDFDTMKHPWYAGRFLFNYEILKDVKEGKLTPENAWRYLCCASQGGDYKPAFQKEYCIDYINYCLENWNHIVSFLEVKNQ